jgi:hypothetical protein
VPDAKTQWTKGITIRGRPSEIWPWVVQMGCNRAGWYSYDGLDNSGVPSAETTIPELQRVEVGDVFPWTRTNRDGFIVIVVQPSGPWCSRIPIRHRRAGHWCSIRSTRPRPV